MLKSIHLYDSLYHFLNSKTLRLFEYSIDSTIYFFKKYTFWSYFSLYIFLVYISILVR